MRGFFSSMFAEMGARRQRLRAAFGDRGQGLVEFLFLTGLMSGSLGLLMRPWMAASAPWGFAIPVVFLAGYLALEAHRQRALAKGGDSEKLAAGFDWLVFLWALASALAGAAAFVIAWGAAPTPAPQAWTPPESAVSVDISP